MNATRAPIEESELGLSREPSAHNQRVGAYRSTLSQHLGLSCSGFPIRPEGVYRFVPTARYEHSVGLQSAAALLWNTCAVPDGWRDDAEEVLSELQAKVSARDLAGLVDFFEDPAVLIGTAGDGRTSNGRREYLTTVTTQPSALRWDWQEIALFYESDDALGFAAFGEVVLKNESEELRAPIRATLLAVRADNAWRLRQFHGSIPQTPPPQPGSHPCS